jgi:hypothetical protein
MPKSFSIGRRTTTLNGLFAVLASALALTLTTGPALAQSAGLDRVEVRGRVYEAPTRYDVIRSCTNVQSNLERELRATWFRERSYGHVDVSFVVTDGHVEAVSGRGISFKVDNDVRRAIKHLECPGAHAGTSIYRLRVAFVDPFAPTSTAVASADAPYAVAIAAIR